MNQIFICNKRSKIEYISRDYPSANIIDVTSKADFPWVKFSPFYPHGNIPVPYSEGYYSDSVEGIWQGLKVFQSHDVDVNKFNIKNMKGIKRTVRKYGSVLGHRKGIGSDQLLNYQDARHLIYIPTYQFVLENQLQEEIQEIRDILSTSDIVLLDYETNTDIHNLKKPLSHASLIRAYIIQ